MREGYIKLRAMCSPAPQALGEALDRAQLAESSFAGFADEIDRLKNEEQALRKALEQLVRLEDMRLRLHKAEESGHGADYYLYRANLSAAWYDARAALGNGK